jgi:hypothetical protein
MIVRIVEGALLAVAIYLAIGSLLALPFLTVGIGRVDPAAKGAPFTFRVLVLPGVVAMWPFILRRWLSSRRFR